MFLYVFLLFCLMRLKNFLLILSNLFLIALFVFYMIIPSGDLELFTESNPNTNFSIGNNTVKMQFYENLRFPSNIISYSIDEKCSLRKKNNMETAFDTIENLTNLEFYEVYENSEINVLCENTNRIEDGLFIAGEGGPTNITETNLFKVILHGEILLIKSSECSTPTVEIHELLHVLGFEHSENKNNIMYPITKCRQTIGEEIPILINDLYSTPTYPDLKFEDANAEIVGRGLSLNISIRNDGLKSSENTTIKISGDSKTLKEIPLKSLEIGQGVRIEIKNIWLLKTKVEEIQISIESNFPEITYENNEILLLKN